MANPYVDYCSKRNSKIWIQSWQYRTRGMQWHLYSSGFLIGLSYAYLDDKHIRVDILHERFSPELKAWVELYGTLVFLIPFLVLIIYFSIPFITSSYELSEISPSPGGLPFRWAIKSMLLIGFAFCSWRSHLV